MTHILIAGSRSCGTYKRFSAAVLHVLKSEALVHEQCTFITSGKNHGVGKASARLARELGIECTHHVKNISGFNSNESLAARNQLMISDAPSLSIIFGKDTSANLHLKSLCESNSVKFYSITGQTEVIS